MEWNGFIMAWFAMDLLWLAMQWNGFERVTSGDLMFGSVAIDSRLSMVVWPLFYDLHYNPQPQLPLGRPLRGLVSFTISFRSHHFFYFFIISHYSFLSFSFVFQFSFEF
jgi:hypothetical protein